VRIGAAQINRLSEIFPHSKRRNLRRKRDRPLAIDHWRTTPAVCVPNSRHAQASDADRFFWEFCRFESSAAAIGDRR